VKQGWTGVVEAESQKEAIKQVEDGNISNEELVDEDGIEIDDIQVEGEEEDFEEGCLE
jgi:hypothetical protein